MRSTGSKGRRGQFVWLALVGVIVLALSLASVSGSAAISPAVAFGLVVTYLAVLAAAFAAGRIDLAKLGRSVQPLAASARMSTAARKATSRARAHPDHGIGIDETVADVGFLLNDRRRDGRWERQIGTVASYDDGYIQPYIKLVVPPNLGDRLTTIEFEFYDRSGRLQFSHRTEDYLRAGDNLLLCDRQLALRGNDDVVTGARAGTWDLRIKVDGALVVMHDFSMSSSSSDRDTQEAEYRRTRRLEVDDADEAPVSLEDLLREQARRNSSSSPQSG